MKDGDVRQFVKDYFSFTRSERKAMLFLCFVLLFSIVFDILADKIIFREPSDIDEFRILLNKMHDEALPEPDDNLRLFVFNPNTISGISLDSLDFPRNIKENLIRYRTKGGIFREPDDIGKLYGMNDSLLTVILPYIRIVSEKKTAAKEVGHRQEAALFRFNPNLVTEEELERLGFDRFQVRNLLNYRSKGGRFKRKSDIMKVYGVDSALFKQIAVWIDLEQEANVEPVREKPETVELNLVDSAGLTLLPGIGPSFAGRIIHYRQALGGFYFPGQILEVYGMSEEKYQQFSGMITVDSTLVVPVRINFADLKTLNRHPYITYSQAKLIIEMRSAEGPFGDSDLLLKNRVFDETSFGKVRHYLSCR